MTTRTSRALLVALGLLVASTSISSSPAFAVVPTSTSAVNTDEQGLAMQGYDPVAYFTVGAPAKGSPTFTTKYKGARYHFASPATFTALMSNYPDHLAAETLIARFINLAIAGIIVPAYPNIEGELK